MLGAIERYRGTFLENMVDSLKQLPNDMARNSALILRLDQRAKDLEEAIERQEDEVLRQAKSGRKMPDLGLMEELRRNQREVHLLNEEKIALAAQAEEMLRSYVERIDTDLKDFEEELDGDVPPDPLAVVDRPRRTIAELLLINPPPRPPRPGEDTYCLCHSISHGQMVGCDGPGCRIEWFHLACVDLDRVPVGNWLCDDCQRERGGD